MRINTLSDQGYCTNTGAVQERIPDNSTEVDGLGDGFPCV